ncbi:hypothetical protein SLS57_003315 [Botryosphaeria dothidea]
MPCLVNESGRTSDEIAHVETINCCLVKVNTLKATKTPTPALPVSQDLYHLSILIRKLEPAPPCFTTTTKRRSKPSDLNFLKGKMAESSPVHAVLHTTELLELILLSLSTTLPGTQTLLATIPFVCSRWRATVATSLPLNRALFLTTVPNRGPQIELKPPGQLPANHCAPADLPRALQPVVNEFLVRRFRLGRFDEPDADFDGGYMPMVSMRWLYELREEWLRDKANDEEGGPSWKRMLIAQPPPRRVEIMVYGSSMFQTVKVWVECDEGVTLGMLHDKCQELARGRDWQKRTMGWYFEL